MKKYLFQLKENLHFSKIQKSFFISFFIHFLILTILSYSPAITQLSTPSSEIDMINTHTIDQQVEIEDIQIKKLQDDGEEQYLERNVQPLGGKASLYLPIFEVTMKPKLKFWIKPVYPESARQTGVEGFVLAEIDLNEKGRVVNIRIIKSTGEAFEKSAIKALKNAKFRPAYKGGDPVSVRFRQPIRFTLD